MRVIIDNQINDAVLSAASGTTFENTLPLSNLKIYNNARLARCSTPNEAVILGGWDSARAISACVLWRHNLSSGATWRLELFSGADQTGETIYDSAEQSVNDTKALNELEWGVDSLGPTVFTDWRLRYSSQWFGRVSARSFRLTLKDSDVSHIDIGRMYLGRYIEPRINMSYGHSLGWQESTSQYRTAGGSLFSDSQEPYRVINFSLDWLSETDRGLWLEGMRLVGLRKDIFISLYPEVGGAKERDYSFAGKFKTMPSFTRAFLNNYAAQYVVEEA